VTITGTADTGIAYGAQALDPELRFVLPTKFGAGARYDIGTLGFAADLEYGLYSENGVQPLRGNIGGTRAAVANAFVWSDAVTARLGVEQRFGRDQQWPVRIGYAFDGKVGNERFPTAFGTPPAPTHNLTAGAGYQQAPWRFDVAYAYRFGSTEVRENRLAPPSECTFCSEAGDYDIAMHGIYVSVAADFGAD
jgi:hypothetical protein